MAVTEKMLTWWEPEFGEEEAEAVAAVIRSGYVNEGVRTQEFTETVAGYLGARHVLATCNGTIAVYLALRACGVNAGDEVIIPDLTFIATASAVRLCGAEPVLTDVKLSDLTIDPDEVDHMVTAKTKAIVPVPINGRCVDIRRLRRTADRHGLAIVEDAAQALGSFINGQALGTLGDVGAISLAPTKIITSGQGGLVVTDRDDIRDNVIRLKDHGRLQRSWNCHPEIGFNFKFSDIYAALARVQFKRLPMKLEAVTQQYQLYEEGLRDVPGVTMIDTSIDAGAVPLWVDALVEDAPGLIEYLKTRSIDCRPFWPTVHTQEPYLQDRVFPNASYAADHGVWFPSGAGKTAEDIQRVIGAVREYSESQPGALKFHKPSNG